MISTGNSSGARLYYPGSNDWWLDPSQGRFDLRVNGGGSPVMKVDSAGAVTSSSHTLTGTGSGSPFDLTSSTGVHILSGKLKLESGAWIEYGDGTSVTSTNTAGSGTTAPPTRQIFTSGSGTYTTPANVCQLRVRMVGGGGGGGATYSGGTAGSNGGPTSFNSVVANGGTGGQGYNGSPGGGAGGTGGTGAASLRLAGGGGGANPNTYGGGAGGSSALGGGAPGVVLSNTGIAGVANTGGGGGGASGGGSGAAACGGGGGEYVELVINSPGASYSYSVGAGGAAGTGGSYQGGAGGSGVIIVDELYCSGPGSGATLGSTQTFSGAETFTSSVTVGPTTQTSTITLTQGALVNTWMVVATTRPSNQTSVYLYGFDASTTTAYRLRMNLMQNVSAGALTVLLNNDSAAHYVGAVCELYTAGTSCWAQSTSLYNGGNVTDANTARIVAIDLYPNPGNSNQTTANIDASYVRSGAGERDSGMTEFTNSPLSSVTITDSAGTFSGLIWVEKLILPVGL